MVRTGLLRAGLRAARVSMLLVTLVGTGGPAHAAEELTTPRGAMLAYLEACRVGDYERGAESLNLRALRPAKRPKEGPRLARELKVVLDRQLWVNLEGLSGEAQGDTDDGLPTGIDRVGTLQTAGGPVDILLQRVRDSSGAEVWQISGKTVSRIGSLYDEFGYGPLAEWLPEPLFTIRFLELDLWQWAGLLLLLVVAWAAGIAFTLVVARGVRRLTRLTETSLDDHLVRAAASPVGAAVAVGVFWGGIQLLALSMLAERFLDGFAKASLILISAWLALRVVDVLAAGFEERVVARGDTSAQTVIHMGTRIVKVFLVVVALLSGLQNLGYNVTGLLAGLGIGGIAVALAMQKTFENFFGSMSLLVDRPVEVGHFCRFGDKIGTIESIGLRSTRIRTLDRTLVSVPNSEFSTLQLENFTERDRIWFHPTLGLRYETTADQLRWILVELRRLLLAHPKVHPDPARVRFVGYGAFSLDLEIFAYVMTRDYNEFLAVREDLLLRIMDVIEQSGSSFAFPSQTLYVGKDDGLADERSRAAEKQVGDWRARNELCLPDFPKERIDEIELFPYPAEGSATARGAGSRG